MPAHKMRASVLHRSRPPLWHRPGVLVISGVLGMFALMLAMVLWRTRPRKAKAAPPERRSDGVDPED